MDESLLCREEGFRAFVKNAGRGHRNPYPASSPEYQQFALGWQQAAQLCGHRPQPAAPRRHETAAPLIVARAAKPRHP